MLFYIFNCSYLILHTISIIPDYRANWKHSPANWWQQHPCTVWSRTIWSTQEQPHPFSLRPPACQRESICRAQPAGQWMMAVSLPGQQFFNLIQFSSVFFNAHLQQKWSCDMGKTFLSQSETLCWGRVIASLYNIYGNCTDSYISIYIRCIDFLVFMTIQSSLQNCHIQVTFTRLHTPVAEAIVHGPSALSSSLNHSYTFPSDNTASEVIWGSD